MTTVLIADDHQLLRQALRRAMEDAGLIVLGEAGDGAEAVQLVDELRPGARDHGRDDAGARWHRGDPARARRVPRPSDRRPHDARRGSAPRGGRCAPAPSAFLTKDSSMQEVVATAIATAAGEALSAELASSILSELAPPPPADRAEPSPLTPPRRGDPPAHRRRLLDERGREPAVHQRQDGEEPPGFRSTTSSTPGTGRRPCSSAVRIGIIHLN